MDTLTGGDTVYAIEAGWQSQLRDEDVEVFKSAADIQMMLGEHGLAPDQEVITYCQTLWRGAHVYYLLRLMGYDNVSGYDGSWAEWGNRTDLPVVTGSEPGSLSEATGGSYADDVELQDAGAYIAFISIAMSHVCVLIHINPRSRQLYSV